MKKRTNYLNLLLATALFLVAAVPMASCSSGDDSTSAELINGGDNGGGQQEKNIPILSEVHYELSPEAVIMPEEVTTQVTNVDETNHTLTLPLSADVPVEGQTLIFNTPTAEMPDGLLAKVKSVTETETGYEITYEEAELGDAFDKIDIPEQYIPLNDKVVRIVDADGNDINYVKEVTRTSGSEELKIVLPEKAWTIEGIDITPKMTIDMAMRYVMRYDDGAIDIAHCKIDADVVLGADVALKKLAESSPVDDLWDLCTVYFAAIPVGPIVVTPYARLVFLFKAEGTVTLEASISYERTVHAHLQYQKSQGLDLKVNLDPEKEDALTYKFGPKFEGGFSYGLSLIASLGIYGKVFSLNGKIDLCKKETISGKLDIAALSGGWLDGLVACSIPALSIIGSKWNFLEWEDLMYNQALTIQGRVDLTVWGKRIIPEFKLPELSLPLSSDPIMPQVQVKEEDFIKYDDSKGEMTLTLHHPLKSMLDGWTEYRAIWKRVGAPAEEEPIIAYFDFDDNKRALLEAEVKTVTSTAKAKLKEGQKYQLTVEMLIFGVDLPVFVQTLKEIVIESVTFEGTVAYSSPDYKGGELQYDTDFKRTASATLAGYQFLDFRTTQTGKKLHVDVMWPETAVKKYPELDPNYKMYSFDIDNIDAIATKEAKIQNFNWNFTLDTNWGDDEHTYPSKKEHWEYEIANDIPMTADNTWELTASQGLTYSKFVYYRKDWEYDNHKDYTECTGTKEYNFNYGGAVYVKIKLGIKTQE